MLAGTVTVIAGNEHNNWKVDGFRKIIINAIAWGAKIKIPNEGFDTPAPTQEELDALRKDRK